MNEVRCKFYRFQKPDGSTKDWAIGYYYADKINSAGSIAVYFGKTGNKLQSRMVRTFFGPPSIEIQADIDRRVNDQLKQGYQYLYDVVIDAQTREVNRLPDSEKSRESVIAQEETLYWIMKPKGVSTDVDLVRNGLNNILNRLTWTLNLQPKENVTGSDGFIVSSGTGFDLKSGRLSSSANITFDLRGGGEVRKMHGALPVLMLMFVAFQAKQRNLAESVDLNFTGQAGDDAFQVKSYRDLENVLPLIGKDISDPEIRSAAEMLELVEPQINFAAIEDLSLANEFF